MAHGPISLYADAFWSSPWDFSCFVALAEKGLEFAMVRAIVRDGQGVNPALVERALVPRVPAMAHGDFFISESNAVVEYLEERFPPPRFARLLPEGLEERARARQVMSFLRADLGALRAARPSQFIFYRRPAGAEPPPLEGAAAHQAAELVALTERLLARPDFATWSIAHADLAFALLRLETSGDPLPEGVRAFVAQQRQRESVRAYLEHPRPPNPPE